MKYMVMIYGDEQIEAEMSQDEWQSVIEGHNDFTTRHRRQVLGGEALEPTTTAKTLRRSGRELTVIDGPFAETKEQLGGFYIIEAETIDDAVAIAGDLPLSDHESVEVRPVMVFGE